MKCCTHNNKFFIMDAGCFVKILFYVYAIIKHSEVLQN